MKGPTSGWLFTSKGGGKAKFGDYDEEFRRLLGRIKEELPSIVPDAAEPLMYSLWHSGQRGATLAVTGRVGKDIIELYNRWRTVESRRGTVPAGLSMQQTYLHVKSSLPQLKMYGAVL